MSGMLPVEEHGSLRWIKATASVPGGMCVELADHPVGVAVRHSKTPEDGALLVSREEFSAFIDGVKRGEFDHLA